MDRGYVRNVCWITVVGRALSSRMQSSVVGLSPCNSHGSSQREQIVLTITGSGMGSEDFGMVQILTSLGPVLSAQALSSRSDDSRS